VGYAILYLGPELNNTRVLVFNDGQYRRRRRQTFVAAENSTFVLPPLPHDGSEPMIPTTPQLSNSTDVPVFVTVVFRLDRFPDDTKWQLFHVPTDSLVMAVDGYPDNQAYKIVYETVAVLQDEEYRFVIKDKTGDGICCRFGNGYAYITLGIDFNDTSQLLVYEDGIFGSEIVQFFNASAQSTFSVTPNPSASPSPSLQPGASLFPSSSLSPSLVPTQTASPSGQQVNVTVVIKLDKVPYETGWSIQRANDTSAAAVVFEVPIGTYGLSLSERTIAQTVRLELGGAYVFFIVDAFGDGICCRYGKGNVIVYLGNHQDDDQILLTDNGRFENERNHTFVASLEGVFPAPTASPLPTMSPTNVPSRSLAPSVFPTSRPTLLPTVTAMPTKEQVYIHLVLQLDRYPTETSLALEEGSGNTILEFSVGTFDFDDSEKVIQQTLSVNLGDAYTVVMKDTAGDGICCRFGAGYMLVYLGELPDDDQVLLYLDDQFQDDIRATFNASPESLLPPFTQGPTQSPTTTPEPSQAYSTPTNPSMYPTVTFAPSYTQVAVVVSIRVDNCPWETSWSIFDSITHQPLFVVNPGTYASEPSESIINTTVMVGKDQPLVFEIFDTSDDGICCKFGNGYAFIGLPSDEGKQLVFDNGEFSSFRRHTFSIPLQNEPTSSPTTPDTSSCRRNFMLMLHMGVVPLLLSIVHYWL